MLKLTASREALMHRASDQAEFGRTLESGQFQKTIESIMDGHSSTPLRSEYLEPRNSRMFKITSNS